MITVLQRVMSASVTVDGATVGSIGHGLLALVAVTREDTDADVKWTAEKLVALRIFRDPSSDKHFELDVRQVKGSILLVSQFTLAADARKGRRPSFDAAAPPEQARQTFEKLVSHLRTTGIPLATGQFQADMQVTLTNDGPVTILLDSRSGRPIPS